MVTNDKKYYIDEKWYVSLCFLYAFENNTPKDKDIVKHIIALEKIINSRMHRMYLSK